MFVRIIRIVASVALAATLLGAPLCARADSGIVALTPHPSEHVGQPPATISAQILGVHGALDKTKVHVTIDGRDVSDAIAVSGSRVDYTPAPALASGEHAVEIAVTDASGGKLSYTWMFTVDGAAPQSAQSAAAQTDAGAPARQAAVQAPPADALQQTAPILGMQDDGSQAFGSFYPLAPGPYYWGQPMNFYFTGVPNGWGFLTFGGIPGVFDLVPLGLGTFFATVPIPIGFGFTPPFARCHFFAPGGVPYVFPYQTPIHIVAHRAPPLLTPPVIGRIPTMPGAQTAPHTPQALRNTTIPPVHRTMAPHGTVHASPVHVMPLHAMPAHMSLRDGIRALRAIPASARPSFAFARPAVMAPHVPSERSGLLRSRARLSRERPGLLRGSRPLQLRLPAVASKFAEHASVIFGVHLLYNAICRDRLTIWLMKAWLPFFVKAHKSRGRHFRHRRCWRHGFGEGAAVLAVEPRAAHLRRRDASKYRILELLAERPRHGYDIIRDPRGPHRGLPRRAPSSVYPTLQMLEEGGFVERRRPDVDGKRIYTITATGRDLLGQRTPDIDDDEEGDHDHRGPWVELRNSAFQLGAAVMQVARERDPVKLARVRLNLDRALREVYAILADACATTRTHRAARREGVPCSGKDGMFDVGKGEGTKPRRR